MAQITDFGEIIRKLMETASKNVSILDYEKEKEKYRATEDLLKKIEELEVKKAQRAMPDPIIIDPINIPELIPPAPWRYTNDYEDVINKVRYRTMYCDLKELKSRNLIITTGEKNPAPYIMHPFSGSIPNTQSQIILNTSFKKYLRPNVYPVYPPDFFSGYSEIWMYEEEHGDARYRDARYRVILRE